MYMYCMWSWRSRVLFDLFEVLNYVNKCFRLVFMDRRDVEFLILQILNTYTQKNGTREYFKNIRLAMTYVPS
jgi:hypothetical protein